MVQGLQEELHEELQEELQEEHQVLFHLVFGTLFLFFHPSHRAQGSKPKAQGSNPKEKGTKNRSPQSPGGSFPQSPGGYNLLNLSKEKEKRKRGCKFRKKRDI